MSRDVTDERELQPLNSSGKRQGYDDWQQQQVTEADKESLDKHSAAQSAEANRASAAQQAPQDAGEANTTKSEVQC